MGKRIVDKSTAVWLMISTGLVALISLQVKEKSWLTPPLTAATFEPAPRLDRDEDRSLVSWPDAGALDDIVDRPLFSASRRPFSPPEVERTTKTKIRAEPLALTLTGILLAGESRIALLTHPADGLLRLRLGQKVDGWRVDQIREDEVHLRRGAEVERLSLRKGALKTIPQPATG